MPKPSNFARRLESVELTMIASAVCLPDGEGLLPQVEPGEFSDRTRASVWSRLRELRVEGDLDVLSAQTDPEVDQQTLADALALEESLTDAALARSRFAAAQRARQAVERLRATTERLEATPLNEDAASERLTRCQHSIQEIQGMLAIDSSEVNMRQDAEDLLASLAGDEGEAVVSFRLPSLDRVMGGGLKRGTLSLVLGHSGHGKSCMGLQAAVRAAESELRVLYVSTEMGGREMVARAASWQAEWESMSFMRTLTIGTEKARKALGQAAELSIEVNDKISTIGLVEARVMRAIGAKQPFGLVVLDFLQMFRGPGEQEHEKLAGIAYDAKHLARRAEIPVLAMVQPKRGESAPTGPPSMHSIRGSSTIQNAADTIISVYSDQSGNPGDPYDFTINVEKARNGQPGELRSKFQLGAGTYRITEIVAQEETLAS